MEFGQDGIGSNDGDILSLASLMFVENMQHTMAGTISVAVDEEVGADDGSGTRVVRRNRRKMYSCWGRRLHNVP